MRPSRDEWGLGLAELTAQRTTCLRRAVGCVLTNARGHVVATGYNGVPAGSPHCNEERVDSLVRLSTGEPRVWFPHACTGAEAASGKSLDGCDAIHAEQNALLQCRDVWAIDTCYVTASPCVTCVKLLLNTSCRRIVFRDLYPHPHAVELWTRGAEGRAWLQLARRG